MSERVRCTVAPVAAALVGLFLFWGMLGLPPVGQYQGPYGDVVTAVAPAQRQVQNVVTAINFDYRGMDTLGEEYILFAAVAGTSLLLRRLRRETDEPDTGETGPSAAALPPEDAVRAWGLGFVSCTLLFGLYIVLHGQLSPGGGFQGGCILASAWLVVFLTGNLPLLRQVTPERLVQLLEATGAGAYAIIGLATLVAGGAFLQNMLPLGTIGSLLSSGTIALINAAVGLEVTGGIVLVLLAFLRETIELHGGQHS